MIKVTVWNEYRHEKSDADVSALYPGGMHQVIAAALEADRRFTVRTATLDESSAGLPQPVLDATDTLIWWGHDAHDEVPDEVAVRVQERVNQGMGFIALHSAHFSKPFKRLMGTRCTLKWRDDGERERVWNIAPSHPVTEGLPEYFEIEQSEMYGEPFEIPEPEQTLFISWFKGGEVFRSGCVWNRGNGRVFYFSPGDQKFPIYRNPWVLKVITNAAIWTAARACVPFAAPRTNAPEAGRESQR
jgi:trehalose utilization protein